MHFNEGQRVLPDLNNLTDDVRSFIRGQAGDVDDADVLAYIEESVLGHTSWKMASLNERVKAADMVFNRVRKDLNILQPFADDPDVSEIMVN